MCFPNRMKPKLDGIWLKCLNCIEIKIFITNFCVDRPSLTLVPYTHRTPFSLSQFSVVWFGSIVIDVFGSFFFLLLLLFSWFYFSPSPLSVRRLLLVLLAIIHLVARARIFGSVEWNKRTKNTQHNTKYKLRRDIVKIILCAFGCYLSARWRNKFCMKEDGS